MHCIWASCASGAAAVSAELVCVSEPASGSSDLVAPFSANSTPDPSLETPLSAQTHSDATLLAHAAQPSPHDTFFALALPPSPLSSKTRNPVVSVWLSVCHHHHLLHLVSFRFSVSLHHPRRACSSLCASPLSSSDTTGGRFDSTLPASLPDKASTSHLRRFSPCRLSTTLSDGPLNLTAFEGLASITHHSHLRPFQSAHRRRIHGNSPFYPAKQPRFPPQTLSLVSPA
ncbi:uncharacterized protein SRS1_17427 [Sporisorium reilianum f. sp. reilianum]|uniref:Secreted protein n=1 Tax=Sporisorium reilianum f. sp. reilianum TaxID=72559 RepID=A0A2N8UFG4_9BASI|nr:uncharacterized protein SRS1_17427 [Sporisorium reilianum f. sp. reilianum]